MNIIVCMKQVPDHVATQKSFDNAHLSWTNKLSPIMAITRKMIRVKGFRNRALEACTQAPQGSEGL